MDEPTTDYRTPRAALMAGARDAMGAPIAVLAAGYVGYGALASGFDFPLWLIVASTLLIFALPGQLIMLEMHAVSAQLVLIVLAVSLSASRFLPMTTVLSAMMQHPRYSRGQMYASAHVVAMTGWVAAVNRVPQLPAEQRLPYFLGFALSCWIACAAASPVGYFLAAQMSEVVKLGLVFMNPIYFLLILAGETKAALGRLALIAGAVTGPVAHVFAPQWSLLAAGLVGGSVAYALHRWRRTA
ncbi:MAG TPA: AzlC family ABC transporter permease [Burkholderiaceae bacterium]|jgi:predicted branched-subunit amino acid permease|nr:AzlC family ABC transporter permease [Burkholderiaceae bacterium]